MSESYRILLRADEAESQTLPRAALRERLRSVPKLVPRPSYQSTDERVADSALRPGDELHEFGEADEHGIMTLTLRGPDAESLSAIEVVIPRPWVMENGPQVFALVFMIQGWTDWEVYDPQIGGTLHREAVLQGLVAMRQARMKEEGRKVPQPRLEENPAPDSDTASGPESAASGPPSPRPQPAAPSKAPSKATSTGPRKRRWRFW